MLLKGKQNHRILKLQMTKEFIPELFVGSDIVPAQPLRPILLHSGAMAPSIRKRLSTTLHSLAHQVINCPLEGTSRRLFLEGKTYEILAWELEEFSFSSGVNNTHANESDVERLYYARNILKQEFVDPPGLLELSRRVGLNDFKLKRGFRHEFGTTVFGYVRRLRMEKARQLLEIGDLSVTEVALASGYSHFGYFASVFKQTFGVLPSHYRRRLSVHRHSNS
jgi:AraC-like DNA-binding protein